MIRFYIDGTTGQKDGTEVTSINPITELQGFSRRVARQQAKALRCISEQTREKVIDRF